MKKWEQLQLTLDKSKSEKRQGDYQDKARKLFKKMRVRVMRYEFKVLSWHGPVREFGLWSVNEGLYGIIFIECLSYRESTVFMNLFFYFFAVSSYGKNRLQRHSQKMQVGYQVYKHKRRKLHLICSLKVSYQVRKTLKRIKIQTILFHVRFDIFCQIQQIQPSQQGFFLNLA